MGEEKGIEGDVPGVWNEWDKDDANPTRIVALANGREKEEENLEGARGGDKTGARGREIISIERRRRDIVEALTYIHARSNVHIHRAVKLARYRLPERLPPRTFGKINRIQEKPMVRQASRIPLSFASLVFSLSLFLSPSLSRPSPFTTLSSTTLPAPLAASLSLSRARAVSVFARDKERASSRVYPDDRRRWAIRVHARRPRTEIRTREGSVGTVGRYTACVRVREMPRAYDSIRARWKERAR